MKPENKAQRLKTFPLELEEDLHKALKHKAIESDLTLHTFIIQTLSSKVQEDSASYGDSTGKAVVSNENKR